MRNSKGQFIKGSGFWTGKKRPGFITPTSFQAGMIPWNKDKAGYKLDTNRTGRQFNTGKTHFKKGAIPWNADKTWEENSGENHWNWKGGITPLNASIRKSAAYRRWRKAVLLRDNYTCMSCGAKENLHVDHIKAFAFYPDLRLNVANGRTLCWECHKQTPTYSSQEALAA